MRPLVLRPRITPGVLLSGGQWVDPITVKFDGTSKLRTAEDGVNEGKIDNHKLLWQMYLRWFGDKYFDAAFGA